MAVLLIASLLLFLSCSPNSNPVSVDNPNILWIYLEDTSPLMGAYDTDVIATPNIVRLAEAEVLYTNVFMPASVCSPSRSSILTGVMSTTLGLHNVAADDSYLEILVTHAAILNQWIGATDDKANARRAMRA